MAKAEEQCVARLEEALGLAHRRLDVQRTDVLQGKRESVKCAQQSR